MVLGERFYQMSNAIFYYDLTPTEFMVYSYLVCIAGQKGVCWPSIGKIAVNCNCSENTVRAVPAGRKHDGLTTSAVRPCVTTRAVLHSEWGVYTSDKPSPPWAVFRPFSGPGGEGKREAG